MSEIPTYVLFVNEGDDWFQIVTIDDSITGDISAYTDWSCEVMPETVLTQQVSASLFDATITVVDNDSRTISLSADNSVTDDLVFFGRNERKLFSDINCTIDGRLTTVGAVNWRVKRKYRKST